LLLDCRQGLSRWRGGRFACTSLIRRWSLERLTVARYDDVLPADSIDAVLLLKTYHEVAHPVLLLRNLRSSLKPGAKIGIIDRNGNGENHGVSKDVVVREAAQAGYEGRDSRDCVKADSMDYFLIFTTKPD